jgi:hypothetical protein
VKSEREGGNVAGESDGLMASKKSGKEKDKAFATIKKSVADSSEHWRSQLVDKYQSLKNISKDNLPGLWDSLEFELSIQKILNIEDCTLPFAGIVLGSPSSLKTVGIELFRKWNHVFYTDSFSAKAFVSHSTAVSKKDLPKIDMLPKIKNKLLLTPELSPTFAKKDDDLIEILGILTRVLDGHGYESDTGAHGHRGYNEPMMFTWAGAAVDIPYKVHKYLGTLGPKLYFKRLPKSYKKEDDYYNELDKNFADKIDKIRVALFDYLEWFESCPDMSLDKESELQKMTWDPEKDDSMAKRYIIRLAMLLAHLRGVVPTWETREGGQGTEYAYTIATIEEPDRAITQLRNLARGHALSLGRNYITTEDIPLVIEVVFSTASMERVRILELLIASGGILTTTQITASLNTSPNTAKRTMAEFKALGIADLTSVEPDKPNSEKQIVLYQTFSWFKTEEFLKLKNYKGAVRNLPPYYSECEYPVRVEIEQEDEGLGGSFPYDKIAVFPPKCYRCDFNNYGTKGEYDYHCITRHPGKPAYPGPADIKESDLTPQGMIWEKTATG